MDEGQGQADMAAVAPDRAGAAGALSLASRMLALSIERLEAGDYAGSVGESRNAIRLASSAMLMCDGVVVGSLEATAEYLARNHPGVFLVEEWVALEQAAAVETPGLYNMLLTAMGKVKKTGEQEAKEAMRVAEAFVSSAKSEMSL
jgi:hypothetical protein